MSLLAMSPARGMSDPINAEGARQGYVSPAMSPADAGRWYAYTCEPADNGSTPFYRYAGVYATRAEACAAAGIEP